jgi:hypothetical protein
LFLAFGLRRARAFGCQLTFSLFAYPALMQANGAVVVLDKRMRVSVAGFDKIMLHNSSLQMERAPKRPGLTLVIENDS